MYISETPLRLTRWVACFLFVSGFCRGHELAKWYPSNTRVFLAMDDFDQFKAKYRTSGVGRMWDSDSFAAFQAHVKDSESSPSAYGMSQYGVDLSMLLDTKTKRMLIGGVELSPTELSFTFLIEVSEESAKQIVASAEEHFQQAGASKSDEAFPVPADIFVKKDGHSIIYVFHDGFLMISGDLATAKTVLALRNDQEPTESLAQTSAYQKALAMSADGDSDLTWFVDIIRLAVTQTKRTEEQEKDPRGPFPTRHGFTGIQGAGGHLKIMSDGLDSELTYNIYAPNREGALQSLAFRPKATTPPEFVPASACNVSVTHLDLTEFFSHIGDVYDDATDAEQGDGGWQSLLDDLQRDRNIDLLGTFLPMLQSTMISITEFSPETNSESTVTVVPMKDPKRERKLAVDLYRAFAHDSQATRIRVRGFKNPLWKLRFSRRGAAFKGVGMMVAGGKLWVGPHVDYIKKMVTSKQVEALKDAPDYIDSRKRLGDWVHEETFAQTFTRTGDDLRTTYDALRTGGVAKLQDTETLYAEILLRLMTDENGEDQTNLDYSLLPPFTAIAHFFGFSAAATKMHEDGFQGVLMSYGQDQP